MTNAQVWLEAGSGEQFPIRGNCSLGRADDNSIIIPEVKASRRHATIHAQEDGEYWLIDLGSSNGTFHNERRVVRPVRLMDQDRVNVAGVCFTFHQRKESVRTSRGAASSATIMEIRSHPCWLLVADIENFTEMSQKLDSDELATLVGGWVRDCKQVIELHGGTINKYLGDGFMAYWKGYPKVVNEVGAALRSLRELHTTGSVAFRVIAHQGQVTMGGAATMGEENLMGKEVNFAFRMEKLAGSLGVAFCLSAAAQQQLAELIPTEPIPGNHELKGFDGTHRFFRF